MMLLAPPRLSIKNCWPIACESWAPSERARMSTAPPAGKPTTIRTGLTGYCCAHTAVEPMATLHAAARKAAMLILQWSPAAPRLLRAWEISFRRRARFQVPCARVRYRVARGRHWQGDSEFPDCRDLEIPLSAASRRHGTDRGSLPTASPAYRQR